MKIQELRNKKIAIVGFAREGKDTLSFLEKVFPQKIKICGDLRRDPVSAKSQRPGLCKLGVFDENPDCLKIRRDLRRDRVSVNSQRPGLCKFRRDRVYVNSCLKGLKDYEVIIKTPGIPEKKIKPFINEKAKLTSQTEIFFANFQGLVIGVTGTKGKGTTSTLIYQILKKAKKKVRLVGNIGKPVLGEFLRAKKDEIFIYELSSHQLQGLYQIKKSPHIAVFLNLFPDHLDYYKNFQEYKKAKEPIFCFQTKNDYFIYNAKDKTAQEFAKKSRARKIDFTKVGLEKKGNVAEKIKTNLMGDFNLL
ncbi:hypothetical protein FJ208_02775, partial [Candidatus Gribaldobacteria bacterium]|nr:hypothetical protein [Candidatus Gribaldobacteria bacterium]